VRPLDFYRFAMNLSRSAADEASCRTVVSRAYYGLHHETCCRFYRVQRYASPLDIRRRHTELLERFNDPLDPVKLEVSSLLGQLLRDRTEADYIMDPNVRIGSRLGNCMALMNHSLRVAEQLLKALEAYSVGESSDNCICKVVRGSG